MQAHERPYINNYDTAANQIHPSTVNLIYIYIICMFWEPVEGQEPERWHRRSSEGHCSGDGEGTLFGNERPDSAWVIFSREF